MLYTDWLVSRSGDIRTASFKISWNPRGACHMFIDNKIGGKSSNGKLVGGLEHVLFFHILGMSSSQLTKSFFQRGRSTTKQQITVWKITIFNGHTIGLDQPLTGSRVNSVLYKVGPPR